RAPEVAEQGGSGDRLVGGVDELDERQRAAVALRVGGERDHRVDEALRDERRRIGALLLVEQAATGVDEPGAAVDVEARRRQRGGAAEQELQHAARLRACGEEQRAHAGGLRRGGRGARDEVRLVL